MEQQIRNTGNAQTREFFRKLRTNALKDTDRRLCSRIHLAALFSRRN
jgi:hypothetical protein